jgi:phage gpG-like protein
VFGWSVDARKFLAVLDRVYATASNPEKMLGKIGDSTKRLIQAGFRKGADPWGEKWRQLSPFTLARRRARGNNSAKPLLDTTRMFQSIETHNLGGDQYVWIAGFNRYPDVHNFGLNNIPKRAMMPVRENGQVELPPDWQKSIFDPADNDFARLIK